MEDKDEKMDVVDDDDDDDDDDEFYKRGISIPELRVSSLERFPRVGVSVST